MSRNTLVVTVLIALAVVAIILRVAAPMPVFADADSRYAAAKFGWAGKTPDRVLMAVGDTPAGP